MLNNFLLQVTVGNESVAEVAEAMVVPEEKTLTVWQLVSSGGTGGAIVMFTLLILSILAVYIMVERFLVIKQASKEDDNFMNQIKDNILDGKIDAEKIDLRSYLEWDYRAEPDSISEDIQKKSTGDLGDLVTAVILQLDIMTQLQYFNNKVIKKGI